MKRLILILTLVLGSALSARAQLGIDTDIQTLRNNLWPDFHYTYGDWIQYSPGVILYALKAGQYETPSSWGRMVTAHAISSVIAMSTANAIKYGLNRERPDGHNLSFPSGHTNTAFMMATWFHKELGGRSPWWSVAGYAVAASTGLQRILENRHWFTDVVGGALLGIASAELAYYLTSLIYKDKYYDKSLVMPDFVYDSRYMRYSSLELYYAFRMTFSDGFEHGSGLGILGRSDLIPGCGIAGRASVGVFRGSNIYSVQAGTYYKRSLTRWLEPEIYGFLGYAYDNAHRADLSVGASLSLAAGTHYRVKGFGEWDYIGYHSLQAGLTVGFYW